jgi:hypothetical protein
MIFETNANQLSTNTLFRTHRLVARGMHAATPKLRRASHSSGDRLAEVMLLSENGDVNLNLSAVVTYDAGLAESSIAGISGVFAALHEPVRSAAAFDDDEEDEEDGEFDDDDELDDEEDEDIDDEDDEDFEDEEDGEFDEDDELDDEDDDDEEDEDEDDE